MLTKTSAPFTRMQVVALNAYQRSGAFHPFTCPHQDNERHLGTETRLVATQEGWRCPYCAYTQLWAHAFMTEAACQECGAAGEPLDLDDNLRIRCSVCAAA